MQEYYLFQSFNHFLCRFSSCFYLNIYYGKNTTIIRWRPGRVTPRFHSHSKRFDHVTDGVMSPFWSWKKLSGRSLLSRKFSLPCDKRLPLHSPRHSLPTFSLMYITPINFKCRTSTGYFKCPTQPKPQMCYLFLTR